MASSTEHYFRTSGITMGWIGLGVVGAVTVSFICTGLIIRHSYEAKNRVSTTPLSKKHYFRISRIPTGWTEASVVGGLKSLEPTRIHDDESPCLSLFQACNDSTQTGILKLENCLELLETTKLDTAQLELSVEGESVCVDIDGHFFGLTPLNTPGNEYIVE
jgi:hypothetical protein